MKEEEINPFVIRKDIDIVKITDTFILHPVKKGVKSDISYPNEQVRFVDDGEKVSVYKLKKEDSNKFLREATPAAVLLRAYIIDRLGANRDYLRLTQTRLNDDIGMNHRTFSRAVKELVYWEYIEKKNRFEYWVNPHKIFHGNRVRFYQAMGMVNVVRSN